MKVYQLQCLKKVQNKLNDLKYTYVYQNVQLCDKNYNVNQQETEYLCIKDGPQF